MEVKDTDFVCDLTQSAERQARDILRALKAIDNEEIKVQYLAKLLLTYGVHVAVIAIKHKAKQ